MTAPTITDTDVSNQKDNSMDREQLDRDLQRRRLRIAADSAHELTCTPWWRFAKRRRLTDAVAFQAVALLRPLVEADR